MKGSRHLVAGVVVVSAVLLAVTVLLVIVVRLTRKRILRCNTPMAVNPHLVGEREMSKELSEINLKYHGRKEITTPTIFVAISSYRDPELCHTLRDLVLKAHNPERVFIGVVQQNDPGDPPEFCAENAGVDRNHIRITSMNYSQAKGPTWARHLCEKLWKGETFHMMTDSHMRFECGWDSELIDMILSTTNPTRSIITMYPEGYTREEKNGTVRYGVSIRRGFRRARFKFFNDQGIPEFESLTLSDKPPLTPVPTAFWAACFHFSHSDTIRLVPFSPNTPFLFFGEEIFMGCRYWTHGFDLYAPTRSVCYHLWTREHRRTFWEHDVIVQRDASIQLVLDLMTGKMTDDNYGLGKERSWQRFWDYAGLDPFTRSATRKSDPWEAPAWYRGVQAA